MAKITGKVKWAQTATPEGNKHYIVLVLDDEGKKFMEREKIRTFGDSGQNLEIAAFLGKFNTSGSFDVIFNADGAPTTDHPMSGDTVEVDFVKSKNTNQQGQYFANLQAITVLSRQQKAVA